MIGTIFKSVVVAGASAGAMVVGVIGGVRLADDWGWFEPSEKETKEDRLFVSTFLAHPKPKKKAKKKAKR